MQPVAFSSREGGAAAGKVLARARGAPPAAARAPRNGEGHGRRANAAAAPFVRAMGKRASASA